MRIVPTMREKEVAEEIVSICSHLNIEEAEFAIDIARGMIAQRIAQIKRNTICQPSVGSPL